MKFFIGGLKMAQFDQSKSMVEIAEEFIRINGKQNIYTLIESVANIKGISFENTDRLTQLYIEMTLSANFVYCGNDEWDLKENNLEMWDKDGSYFNRQDYEEEDEDDDNISLEDYFIPEEIEELHAKDDDDEEDKDLDDEEVIIIDDDIPIYSTDDDDRDIELDFDDDDYNKIMDDYEDMYDK